jgi:hypothetical protein
MDLRGRREIFTDVEEITKENICQVMDEAFETHLLNATEIEYLKDYEKGKQPILDRIKEVRPEINYKVVENHATEITTFKVGYVFGSPITYVQRATIDANGNSSDVDDNAIALLNEMMFEESKASKDKQLAKDFSTCGIGYRIVLPKKERTGVSAVDIYAPRRSGILLWGWGRPEVRGKYLEDLKEFSFALEENFAGKLTFHGYMRFSSALQTRMFLLVVYAVIPFFLNNKYQIPREDAIKAIEALQSRCQGEFIYFSGSNMEPVFKVLGSVLKQPLSILREIAE